MIVAESRIRLGDVCTTADVNRRRHLGDDGPSVDRNGFAYSEATVPDLKLDSVVNTSVAVFEDDEGCNFENEILTGAVCFWEA